MVFIWVVECSQLCWKGLTALLGCSTDLLNSCVQGAHAKTSPTTVRRGVPGINTYPTISTTSQQGRHSGKVSLYLYFKLYMLYSAWIGFWSDDLKVFVFFCLVCAVGSMDSSIRMQNQIQTSQWYTFQWDEEQCSYMVCLWMKYTMETWTCTLHR